MNVGIGQIGTRVNIFLHGTFPKLVFLIFDAVCNGGKRHKFRVTNKLVTDKTLRSYQ